MAPKTLRCPVLGCRDMFRSQHGRTYHVRLMHQNHNIMQPTQSGNISPPNIDEMLAPQDPEDAPEYNSPPPLPPANKTKIIHPFLNGAAIYIINACFTN